MNGNNYCTLEMSRRLVEAGIRIRPVEFVYLRSKGKNIPDEWDLAYQKTVEYDADYIPAPSMAELWALLPNHVVTYKQPSGNTYVCCEDVEMDHFFSMNPCDALAELLLYVEGRKG